MTRIGIIATLRRLRATNRGATVVEFALVSLPLIFLIMGLIDLGMRQYLASQLQGTMDQAARQVTVGGVSTSAINAFVSTRMKMILPGSTVVVTPKSYYDFATVGKPEPITTDTPPLGVFNTGDCFQDLNGNGVWDSDAGASGFGGSDDIIYYTAVATYPALVPVGKLFGWSSTETITATMMMRNQPYASQSQPIIKCT